MEVNFDEGGVYLGDISKLFTNTPWAKGLATSLFAVIQPSVPCKKLWYACALACAHSRVHAHVHLSPVINLVLIRTQGATL